MSKNLPFNRRHSRLINFLGSRVLWNGLQNGVEGPFSESDIVEAWEEIEGMASSKGVTPQQPPVTAENRIESPSVAAEHVVLNEDATVSFGELDDDKANYRRFGSRETRNPRLEYRAIERMAE